MSEEGRMSSIKNKSGSGNETAVRVFGSKGKKAESKPSSHAKAESAKKTSSSDIKAESKKKDKLAKAKKRKSADKPGLMKRIGQAIKSRLAALIAVLLILLTAAACVGIYYFTLVDRISVTGCESHTETEIINAAGLYTGKNILTYDTKAIAKKLAEDPYLDVISVKRVFPNELSIVVAERTEYAAISTGTGGYCVIDREGCILDVSRESIEGLLPVYGLSTIGYKTGKYINEDKSILRPYVLMELFDAFGARDGEIAGVDLSMPASLKITTRDGYTVMLGDSVDIAAKVQRMFEALDKAREIGSEAKTIYINSTGSADFSSGAPTATASPAAIPTAEPAETSEPAEGGGDTEP